MPFITDDDDEVYPEVLITRYRSTRATMAITIHTVCILYQSSEKKTTDELQEMVAVPVRLSKSPRREKKWRVVFPNGKHVDFGAAGASDLLRHGDLLRRNRYLFRHRKHENWKKSGMYTAGFWSRWLLWSVPTMSGAKSLILRKFGLRVV